MRRLKLAIVVLGALLLAALALDHRPIRIVPQEAERAASRPQGAEFGDTILVADPDAVRERWNDDPALADWSFGWASWIEQELGAWRLGDPAALEPNAARLIVVSEHAWADLSEASLAALREFTQGGGVVVAEGKPSETLAGAPNLVGVERGFAAALVRAQQGWWPVDEPVPDVTGVEPGLVQTPMLRAPGRPDQAFEPSVDVRERALRERVESTAPIPGWWRHPDAAPAFVATTIDEENFGDRSAWIARAFTEQGLASTTFVIPDEMTAAGVQALEDAGSSVQLHWNPGFFHVVPFQRLGLGPFQPVERTLSLVDQHRALEELGGLEGDLLLNRNHGLVWDPEFGRSFRMLHAAGVDFDATYGPTGEDVMGYIFGTGLPFRPLDAGGWPFPLVEIPFQYQDDEEFSRTAQSRLVREAVERYHTLVVPTFHTNTMSRVPSREAMEGTLELGRVAHEAGAATGDLDTYALHWRHRLTSPLTSSWDGETLRIDVDAAGPRQSVRVPASVLGAQRRRCLGCRGPDPRDRWMPGHSCSAGGNDARGRLPMSGFDGRRAALGAAVVVASIVPDLLLANPGGARLALVALIALGVGVALGVPRITRGLESVLARRRTIVAVAAAWMALGLFVTWLRVHAYQDANGRDLAYHCQVLWNTAQGRFGQGSMLQELYFDPPLASHIGLHVSPTFLALTPVYALFPGHETLLVVKLLATVLTVVPLYLVARRTLGAAPAALVSIAFLLHPTTLEQMRHEFYPINLAAPALLWSWWAWERRRMGLFVASMVVTIGVREDIALMYVAFAGVWLIEWWTARRSAGSPSPTSPPPLRWALVPAMVGIVWFVVSTRVIMPAAGGGAVAGNVMEWYSGYGDTPDDIVRTVLTDPIFVLGVVLVGPKLLYLWQLGRPFLMAPIAGRAALLTIPALAINLLVTGDHPTFSVTAHYSVAIVAVLAVAAVGALGRIRTSRGDGATFATALVLCAVSLSAVTDTFHGAARSALSPPAHADTIAAALALVPPQATVAAPNTFVAHVADAERVYDSEQIGHYPEFDTDVVILDLDPSRSTYGAPDTEALAAREARLRASADYRVALERDAIVVFVRRAKDDGARSGSATRTTQSVEGTNAYGSSGTSSSSE